MAWTRNKTQIPVKAVREVKPAKNVDFATGAETIIHGQQKAAYKAAEILAKAHRELSGAQHVTCTVSGTETAGSETITVTVAPATAPADMSTAAIATTIGS